MRSFAVCRSWEGTGAKLPLDFARAPWPVVISSLAHVDDLSPGGQFDAAKGVVGQALPNTS
jgi:hypothetical protein